VGENSLIFDGAETVKSINSVPIWKKIKEFQKNIKFNHQKYFNMNIMFNSLN
jgi:hypothetical protein